MKTPELDLHGIRHHEIEDVIEEFVFSTEPPYEIITGNSQFMKETVFKLLKKHKLSAFYKNPHNTGSIIVVTNF